MRLAARRALGSIGVVSFGPAGWWILERINDNLDEPDPDYMFGPLEIPTSIEHAVGLASIGVASVTTVWLVVSLLRTPARHRYILPTAWAAWCCVGGITLSITTKPTVGANIGGGMMVMMLMALSTACLVWTFDRLRGTRDADLEEYQAR